MQLTIHRGSHEIGGSCIEVSAEGTRIILDAGLPLDPADQSVPQVSGLFTGEGAPVDALFLSHAHADHAGLIHASDRQVPVYLSAGTSKMLLAGGLFARQQGVPRFRQRTIIPGDPVQIGALRVTAFPVDHSIYDSMAFIVEGNGKRLLYTGDFRFHGRKPGMMKKLKQEAQRTPLDILVIEGTRLGGRADEPNLSERNLERMIASDLKQAPGIVLAMYSPLNVDRFVSYYKAALSSGRIFVVDPYQAFVLHLIAKQAKVPEPQANSRLRVLIPTGFEKTRAGRVLAGKAWFRKVQAAAISIDEIMQEPRRILMLYRPSMKDSVFSGTIPKEATCLYSYWAGYLEKPEAETWKQDLVSAGGLLLLRHASGHAHAEDLRRFINSTQARIIIPNHTEWPQNITQITNRYLLAIDGEAFGL